MKTYEILTIVAIILGPIMAVQIDKFLVRRSERINRKLWIFKTLMATRGTVLSSSHVEALNRIDLEFSDNTKYRKVLSNWKEYFDNLSQRRAETQEEIIVWSAKNEELLANLLLEMGQSLGYKFDKALIKRNIYYPSGHGIVERENELIRKGLLNILNNESSLSVNIGQVNLNEEASTRQEELQKLLIEYYQLELYKKKQISS
jgi:hypothetical protein